LTNKRERNFKGKKGFMSNTILVGDICLLSRRIF